MPPKSRILQRDGRPMLKKVNPTVITLGIAGILAVAVGFYVNSVTWGPVAEQKNTQAEAVADNTATSATSATTPAKPANEAANTAPKPTWAASATGRVEPT